MTSDRTPDFANEVDGSLDTPTKEIEELDITSISIKRSRKDPLPPPHRKFPSRARGERGNVLRCLKGRHVDARLAQYFVKSQMLQLDAWRDVNNTNSRVFGVKHLTENYYNSFIIAVNQSLQITKLQPLLDGRHFECEPADKNRKASL